ncbi:hypothetical protein B0H13DRAFT_2041454 [Mycena leptocephala]|nr:hypothetical protein B0H13DRAFT_2041454 [Mycena leptocephala]
MRCDRLQRRPTVCSKPDTVAQREYNVHHHQRTQHTLQLFPITHATFVPSPCAHHLQRRSALTARLPCLHVLRYSPQHHLRAPRTFSRPRCAHRIRPPRRSFPPSHRPTPALPVYSTKASATSARGAACADGVDPQRYDAPAKSAQAHGDDAQPPLGQQLRCGQELRSRCAPSSSARHLRPPFGNADPPQACAGERGGSCGIAGEVLVPTQLTFLFRRSSFITALCTLCNTFD